MNVEHVLLDTNVLVSEDFQHRRKIGAVTFLNPFADDFDPLEVLPS